MKDRIFKNWTIFRAFYLVLGLYIAVSSAIHYEWLGTLFGAYFASMGIFAFGCAAGQCAGGNCHNNNPLPKNELDIVEYDDVK